MIRPDPAAIRYLKHGRRRRLVVIGIGVVCGASIVIAHLPIVGPTRDDWSAFDHKTLTATRVDRGIVWLDGVGPVRPVGVYFPIGPEAGAAETDRWLVDQLVAKPITLMVDHPQTRDADGTLRARLYLAGPTDLAISAVKAGMAYVDRRGTDPFRPALAAAESDARKHERGLWAGLRFDQMPPWRQTWLRHPP